MDTLLARLERRFGRYAPSGLTWWLVGLQGIVYFLIYARPELASDFTLSPEALANGEVWRLLTFLFMPWSVGRGVLGPVWMVFAMMMLHTIGTSLEAQWGSFRFDFFLLLATLGTIASSLVFGSVTNQYILTSLWLAFAVEFPDYTILLFFILPVKAKWLGLLSGGLLAWALVTGDMGTRAGIVVAMAAFLFFCGPTLLARLRGLAGAQGQSRRSDRYRADSAPVRRSRVCARCGKSEKDDPRLEFRVCDCPEKCGGRLTEYCLEHARAH